MRNTDINSSYLQGTKTPMWNGDIFRNFSPIRQEGLIILSHTLSSKELAEYHVPIVTIEREDEYVCSVNTDNYMGGVQGCNRPRQKRLRHSAPCKCRFSKYHSSLQTHSGISGFLRNKRVGTSHHDSGFWCQL